MEPRRYPTLLEILVDAGLLDPARRLPHTVGSTMSLRPDGPPRMHLRPGCTLGTCNDVAGYGTVAQIVSRLGAGGSRRLSLCSCAELEGSPLSQLRPPGTEGALEALCDLGRPVTTIDRVATLQRFAAADPVGTGHAGVDRVVARAVEAVRVDLPRVTADPIYLTGLGQLLMDGARAWSERLHRRPAVPDRARRFGRDPSAAAAVVGGPDRRGAGTC